MSLEADGVLVLPFPVVDLAAEDASARIADACAELGFFAIVNKFTATGADNTATGADNTATGADNTGAWPAVRRR